MTYFHELCHGNCALRYVGGILRVKKLDFRGLKCQFEVKRASFKGLIARIDYLSAILATRTPCGLLSWNMPWEMYPKVCWRNSRGQKIDFRGLKGYSMSKKPILGD